MKEPNIGKIIKKVLAKQGRSITWLAQQMGTTRNLVYKMFDREIIYTDRLLRSPRCWITTSLSITPITLKRERRRSEARAPSQTTLSSKQRTVRP